MRKMIIRSPTSEVSYFANNEQIRECINTISNKCCIEVYENESEVIIKICKN